MIFTIFLPFFLTKKTFYVIIERYYTKLFLEFYTNKRICDEIATNNPRILRNRMFRSHSIYDLYDNTVHAMGICDAFLLWLCQCDCYSSHHLEMIPSIFLWNTRKRILEPSLSILSKKISAIKFWRKLTNDFNYGKYINSPTLIYANYYGNYGIDSLFLWWNNWLNCLFSLDVLIKIFRRLSQRAK